MAEAEDILWILVFLNYMKIKRYIQNYVKICSNFRFVTRFKLLISGGNLYEFIVFKKNIAQFYYPVNFCRYKGGSWGLKQNCYAVGNLAINYILAESKTFL
jgi:hypothetical protein